MKIVEVEQEFRYPLLSYFRRRLAIPHEAEDLVQDVFLRLGQRRDLNGVDNPKGYVFRIAANLLRDHVRHETSRKRCTHVSVSDLLEEARVAHQFVDEIEPERILIGKDKLAGVHVALDRLSARTREIFLLYRVEGLRRNEIARRFGISVSAVEKHLAKAIGAVTAHLAADDA